MPIRLPNATIISRRDLHEGLMLIQVRPDAGEFPPFLPGQFVSVGRPVEGDDDVVKRSYSIGSSARERRYVELFIVHVDDGAFTEWLFAQREGDRVWLSPKAGGGFTLEGFARGRDLVMVTTGTAVAPAVSMYRSYHEAPPWRRFVIVNGVRHARDLGYRDELTAAAARDASLVYLPMTTREPGDSGWMGLRGRVNTIMESERFRALTGVGLDPSECHVYLCGNPEMIEELEPVLTGRGFRKHTRHHPGNLHLEKYWTD